MFGTFALAAQVYRFFRIRRASTNPSANFGKNRCKSKVRVEKRPPPGWRGLAGGGNCSRGSTRDETLVCLTGGGATRSDLATCNENRCDRYVLCAAKRPKLSSLAPRGDAESSILGSVGKPDRHGPKGGAGQLGLQHKTRAPTPPLHHELISQLPPASDARC